MKTTVLLCAAATTFALGAHIAHAESPSAFIEQVPPSLSDGRLESEIVIRAPRESGPSESPLNLDFRLTNTPQPSASGGGNISTIRQNGNDNRAAADIQGGGNTTSQVQSGDHNTSDIAIAGGYDNTVSVDQNGDNHRSTIDLTNTVGQEVIHIQRGSGKVATTSHSGTATNGPIIIEQR